MADKHGEKIVLPRGTQLWDVLEREWAKGNRKKWKHLAMIHLRVYCGWRFDMIAKAFGHRKGHAARAFYNAIDDLKSKFAFSAPVPDELEEPARAEEEDVEPIPLPPRDENGRFRRRRAG